MELFKEYQVIEHVDGEWSVVKADSRLAMGNQQSARISVVASGFITASEAQELVDKLNEEVAKK